MSTIQCGCVDRSVNLAQTNPMTIVGTLVKRSLGTTSSNFCVTHTEIVCSANKEAVISGIKCSEYQKEVIKCSVNQEPVIKNAVQLSKCKVDTLPVSPCSAHRFPASMRKINLMFRRSLAKHRLSLFCIQLLVTSSNPVKLCYTQAFKLRLFCVNLGAGVSRVCLCTWVDAVLQLALSNRIAMKCGLGFGCGYFFAESIFLCDFSWCCDQKIYVIQFCTPKAQCMKSLIFHGCGILVRQKRSQKIKNL